MEDTELHNILKYKKIKEELKESQEKFMIMFENNPIATWLEDFSLVYEYFEELKSKGVRFLDKFLDENPSEVTKMIKLVKILDVNKAALEMHKARNKEELIESLGETFTHAAFLAFKDELIQIWEGNSEGESDSIVKTLSNENRDVIINYRSIPSLGKKSYQYLVTLKDVTEKKKIEEAKIRNHSLNALGEMASSVAHDFNNSLQSILGNLELAMNDNNISIQTLDILNTIKIATIDAANRVKVVRRFGHENENENYALVSIESLIKDVIVQSKPIWKDDKEKDGVSISIETNFNNLSKVFGNSSELRSAIYNILKNSIEAMPNGGKVKFHTSKSDKGIELSITDNGVGMTSEVKSRVFQPFYTTKGYELGRGLGMSGVFSIIKEHNAQISVTSEKNKGTSVKIVFPYIIVRKESIPKRSKAITKSSNSKKLKILWVDDEYMIRDVAKKYIKLAGHSGKTACDGLEALELLSKDKYDLIITDIGMPNMNGWQLIEEVDKRYSNKIKIIVVTGWENDIPQNSDGKKHFYASLQKPIQFKDLKSIIDLI